MDFAAKQALKKLKTDIVADLVTKYVVNHLLSKNIITQEEYDDIKLEKNETKSAEKLLNVLLKGRHKAFEEFIFSLRRNGYYPWLADKLEDEYKYSTELNDKNIDSEISNLLLRGGVPREHMYHVKRDDLIKIVKDALNTEYSNRGWVVLHGMTGCGKTMLAASTLWEESELIQLRYSSGVFWISCGEDESSLLVKMQSLCEKLDKSYRNCSPYNIEVATDRLRVLFTESKYEDALVVLDDVWTENVIGAFNFGCRVLVTTKDSGIMGKASSHITYVPITTGFTKEESLQLFANYGKCDKNNLPTSAGRIHDICKGVPILMATVAGYLSDYKEDSEMWEDCYTKLRKRRRYSGEFEDKNKWIENIDAVIGHSVTNLKDELKRHYDTFAVFLDDTLIPVETLSTFWNCEPTEVKDIITQLSKKSLIHKSWNEKRRSYDCFIHDLHLHYLKKTNAERLKEFHKQLIKQYEIKCNGYWEKLPDDYIFMHIGYHLHSADMIQLMSKLFLNLKFILAKIDVTGTADVLQDYRRYRNYIESNIENAMTDFVSFVSQNASLLNNDQYDNLQLALGQPHSSEVYKQAKEIIRLKSVRQSFYLDWCCRDVLPKQCISSSKNHKGPVLTATFTHFPNKYISCGSDGKIRVWDSEFGKELTQIDGHDKAIRCCSMSTGTKKLVTCSFDKTVKVWHLELHFTDYSNGTSDSDSCNESPRTPSILKSQDNLPWSFHPLELDGNGSQYFVRTFSEKFHVPLCCAISPDGQFVFSGGEAGDIKVWSLVDDSIVKISQGHTKAVVCCQFSPDGGRAATGSLDGSVFLWNRSWSCTKIIDENPFYPVVSCCFSADGCKILTAINDSVWTYEILTRKREKIFTDCTQSAINSIAVSQNQLAVGTASSSVVIISLDSNEKIFHTGHKGWVHKVAFSEGGDRLVSSSEDGFVLVWDTLNEFPSGIKYRKCVDAIFKDDDTVALANRDNSVDIIRNNKKCDTIDATDVGSLITCCVLNHHCDKLAICCENGILKIFDLITGSLQETNNIHAKRILCCQFSFDDSVLATGSEDCHIGLIADRNLTRSCRSILCHTESIVAIKFFNDDTKLLTCSYDQTLVVLEISTGNILFNCCGHEGSVVACDITSDNQIIGSVSVDQTAKIWNSINGYVINTLHHDACVRSCRFSPNCSLLITGDDNGEIRIWDLSQNIMDTPIFKLKNALTSCWVNELLISSDSKTLLAASDSIKWWDIKSGSCLQTFPIQGNLLRHVCASPRFEKFVAVDNANVFYYLKKIMLPICQ